MRGENILAPRSFIERFAKILRLAEPDNIVITHHNDADGITSAYILKTALERKNYNTRLICVEALFPEIIKKINDIASNLVIYIDIGASIASTLFRMHKNENFAVIVDHHIPDTTNVVHGKNFLLINPEIWGISGDLAASCSTITYVIAKYMDRTNTDLAHLAVIGAIGDGHHRVSGRLLGLNRRALADAVAAGQVEVRLRHGKEIYLDKYFNHMDMSIISDILTTLGVIGYYSNGPQLGLRTCEEGVSEFIIAEVTRLEKLKEKLFGKVMDELKERGLKIRKFVQWFNVENRFEPMGIGSIGMFCDLLKNANFIDKNKYIIGFQMMNPYIPNIGYLHTRILKLSMRVPDKLEMKIRKKEIPGFDEILIPTVKMLNGLVYSCHKSIGAAALVKANRYIELIELIDQRIRYLVNASDGK